MLDIIGIAFFRFSILVKRAKYIALKCFIYGVILLYIIAIIQVRVVQLNDKYMSYGAMDLIIIGIIILLILIIVFEGIETFFKAMHCWIQSRDKNAVARTSMHEAGHALIAELFFPRVNKQTIICNGILGCWDGANYNCSGISLFDEFRLSLYIESNKKLDMIIMEYQLYILLAGYVAENLHVQSDEMVYQLFADVNNSTDKESDYTLVRHHISAISQHTNQSFDNILINAIFTVKSLLLQNEYILIEISNLLLKKRKIKGDKISNIVGKYCPASEYSSLKITKWGYFKVALMTILKWSGSGTSLVLLYQGYKNIIVDLVRDVNNIIQIIKQDPQIIKTPRFKRKLLTALLFGFISTTLVVLLRKVLGILH